MVLDLPAIERICTTASPAFITAAVKQAKKLALHVNGEGLDQALEKIEGFERDEKLRKKHAKSNRDLFERLSRPLDKVWSAKGGSLYYNLTDQQEALARGFAANVFPNVSIKNWLRQVWQSHLKDDPAGVMFLEVMKSGDIATALQRGQSIVYPTYKPVTSIHAYQLSGTRVEWIVFAIDAKYVKELGYTGDTDSAKFDRVVDDVADYIVFRKASVVGEKTPGEKLTSKMFASTATVASQDLAAWIHGQLTEMSMNWFSLKIDGLPPRDPLRERLRHRQRRGPGRARGSLLRPHDARAPRPLRLVGRRRHPRPPLCSPSRRTTAGSRASRCSQASTTPTCRSVPMSLASATPSRTATSPASAMRPTISLARTR
jgi:hypothetical protein